jgi:beta-xylosidase
MCNQIFFLTQRNPERLNLIGAVIGVSRISLHSPTLVQGNQTSFMHFSDWCNLQPMKIFLNVVIAVCVYFVCAKDMYKNPVLFSNIPDPGVIYLENKAGAGWLYSISTSNYQNSTVFPVFRSKNLVHWEYVRHLFLENPPKWTYKDFWAPELHSVMNGTRLVVYYTARTRDTKTLSIGAAWLDVPHTDDVHDVIQNGRWRDLEKPLYYEQGVGYIDAHLYQEDGKLWFLWKNDGNDFRPPRPTHIFIQEMESSGLSLKSGSERKIIFTNNPQSWEMDVVEAPWLIKVNNLYYLFYSGGPFYNHHYSLGVATSSQLTNTFDRMYSGAVLKTSNDSARDSKGRDIVL